MAKQRKKRELRKEDPPAYTFTDDVTRDKMERHINNINDVITDEDIARVKIPGTEIPLTPPENESENNEEVLPAKPEGKPVTPWDVID